MSFVATTCGAGAGPNEVVDNRGELTITDAAGRTVTFDKQPERVMLSEGRAMFITAMLDRGNPGDHIAVMGSDLHPDAPSFETKLSEMNPEPKGLPAIGDIAKGDVAVKDPIFRDPDVVVITLDHKKTTEESGFLTRLDQTGLKYVFIDFRQRPLENTTKSVGPLGQVTDEQDSAKEFTNFHIKRVNEIAKRAVKLEDRPKAFVWQAADLKDCCSTVNRSNLGDLITAAGGENFGDSFLDTESGDTTAEKVLSVQPEKIIATGGPWALDPKKLEILPHVELGYTATPETTRRTLKGLLKTPGPDVLTTPRKGDLYAAFRQFYDPPHNAFILEQFARWVHPEEFADLDPVADFTKSHKNYLPFELSGTFSTALKPIK